MVFPVSFAPSSSCRRSSRAARQSTNSSSGWKSIISRARMAISGLRSCRTGRTRSPRARQATRSFWVQRLRESIASIADTDRHRMGPVFFCFIVGGSGTRARASGSDGNASAENCMSSTGCFVVPRTPRSWRSAASRRSCPREFVTSSPWTRTPGFPLEPQSA